MTSAVEERVDSRTPPNDVAAEQSVLGGMLLSKDAIADVVEILHSGDFYRPNHSTVFDAILKLYGDNEPADAVTVAAALMNGGDLGRVGGAAYLHTLIQMVPTAASAGFYARIVAERAVLRRLVTAGTQVAQLGYAAGDADEAVDRAQQLVYDITERRGGDDFASLGEMLQPTLDKIEADGSSGGVMTGVSTGFADLDRLLNGLHPGQLVIIGARPSIGKALALDTPLPTPDGWTTMGQVSSGDWLLGSDGKPTRVLATSDVMTDRVCYEVEFSDGAVITADAEHLWSVTTRASRRQASETHTTLYWPEESMRRLREREAAVGTAPDRLVSYAAAVAELGPEFRNILHGVAQAAGPAGTVTRQIARYTNAGDLWTNRKPAYSIRALAAGLLEKASRPMNAATTASHPGVATTKQIAEAVLTPTPERRCNYAVMNARPLDLPHKSDLPVTPYALGVWLGDGHSAAARFTTADPEIVTYIEGEGYVVRQNGPLAYSIQVPPLPPLLPRRCEVCGCEFAPPSPTSRTCGRACGSRSARGRKLSPRVDHRCETCGGPVPGVSARTRRCAPCHRRYGSVAGALRELNVLNNKHIPPVYLRASERQRRELLAGLLDTDGTVAPTGNVQFSVTSRRLAEDTKELVTSLGYRCAMSTKRVKGRTDASSIAYTLNFSTTDEVFRLERKKQTHKERLRPRSAVRTDRRYIVDVRRVDTVPVRCVMVDNADHLYLAGRSMVPTHNSTLILDLVRAAAIRHSLPAAIFSLEMSKIEIVTRLLSAEARVPLHVLRSGHLSDDDWARLARRMGEISEAPLFIDDTANMTLMEIRSKARRLTQQRGLRLVAVDYLQLMTVAGGSRPENRQAAVDDIARGLKLLAKELGVPVVVASQLNRGPEQRTDKRPMLSDLRESGGIENHADVVILLHRDDYYDKESARAGEADFVIAKHRNGPTDTVTVAAQLHFSRFVDMSIGP